MLTTTTGASSLNRKVVILLVLFLVLDTAFSFVQHLHFPHDGDMAAIILPADWYAQVLKDPFGLGVITNGERYSATNRFFAHWSLSAYFKNVPLWLQHFVTPIQSTYLASAIAKILLQVGLIYILAAYITGTWRITNRYLILAAVLMAPMFQTAGFYNYIAIIDQATTYTFFYSLPMAVLLLFYFPFYRAYVLGQGFTKNLLVHVLLVIGLIIIPFHGPLSAAIIMIVCPGALLYFWLKALKQHPEQPVVTRIFTAIGRIPAPVLGYFTAIVLVSVYSFYIGTFNAENAEGVSLAGRYALLPQGLFYQLFGKLAFPVLLAMLLLNCWLLKKHNHPESKWLLRLLLWLSLFAVVYLLLLPLGGYRPYRPYIIRRDTFLPVTLSILFFFGISTLFIFRHLQFSWKKAYLALVAAVLVFFTYTDRDWLHGYYVNEKKALKQIADSKENPAKYTIRTPIMSWEMATSPAHSDINAELLELWRITPEKRLYYYAPE